MSSFINFSSGLTGNDVSNKPSITFFEASIYAYLVKTYLAIKGENSVPSSRK